MPSDYQKKKLAQKKEAAKKKGGKKAPPKDGQENGVTNGVHEEITNGFSSTNGTKENSSEPTTYEGNIIPNYFAFHEIWLPI